MRESACTVREPEMVENAKPNKQYCASLSEILSRIAHFAYFSFRVICTVPRLWLTIIVRDEIYRNIEEEWRIQP
jgi:hypothetical protein